MTGTAVLVVKLRCASCWGDAHRSASDTGMVTKIECGLCKRTISEEAARCEADAIAREATSNLSRITQGKPAKYRSGANFVAKLFPEMPRDTDAFNTRIEQALKLPNKNRRYLTRRDVPAGEAGYLYLQAKLFAAAVRTFPSDPAIQRWEEAELCRLTALRFTHSNEKGIHIKAEMQDPTSPKTLDERAGLLMMRGLTAALSCELALKAILMTRNHRAKKTHNLLDLYTRLPADSQARVRGDYPAIRGVLEYLRDAFGTWRYFENSASVKEVVERNLHHERVADLERAARVLVDECETVGLDGTLAPSMDANRETLLDDRPMIQQTVSFTADSGESAFVWPQV